VNPRSNRQRSGRAARIGLALGSGSARGWAHIGVVRALERLGIDVDVVCGSSIGALVGAALASGQLDRLEDWARSLERVQVLRLLDPRFTGGGLIRGSRLMQVIGTRLDDVPIESMPIPFAAVATDLGTGHEVWITKGPMLAAARASSGIPGIFAPTEHEGRWVVDGGLVNPVPTSLCRALGADRVLAVGFNFFQRETRLKEVTTASSEPLEELEMSADSPPGVVGGFTRWLGGILAPLRTDSREVPGILSVVGSSLDIMQDRIARSRMVGDAPDVILMPKLPDIGMLDFHLADEAIRAGEEYVERSRWMLEDAGLL